MFAWFSTHKILTLLLAILILVVALITFSNYIDNEIDKAIGTEASDISQCRVLPIGKKACGGPAGYIIYSTKTSDIDRYLSLIATRSNLSAIIWLPSSLLELALTGESGPGASTCNIEVPPALEFADGKCRELRN